MFSTRNETSFSYHHRFITPRTSIIALAVGKIRLGRLQAPLILENPYPLPKKTRSLCILHYPCQIQGYTMKQVLYRYDFPSAHDMVGEPVRCSHPNTEKLRFFCDNVLRGQAGHCRKRTSLSKWRLHPCHTSSHIRPQSLDKSDNE